MMVGLGSMEGAEGRGMGAMGDHVRVNVNPEARMGMRTRKEGRRQTAGRAAQAH